MHSGDLVTRISHGHDIIFRIIEIRDQTAYLVGELVRLQADSPVSDLVISRGEIEKEEPTFAVREEDPTMVKGKVLHLDGDERYLKQSLKWYETHQIPAVGYSMPEKEMASMVINLLVKHKPDILVITGHDAQKRNRDGTTTYTNSEHFIQTVKSARIYEPSKDTLVIFAGACQSFYEGMIASGANFASSPTRVNINIFDPVQIAAQVSQTHVKNFVNIESVLENTTSGGKGLGGIDTRGVARRIYYAGGRS